MMNPKTKKNVRTRLNRAAGQLAAVQRMVDEDRYCVDVLLQLSAARAALARIGGIMLDAHIRSCVRDAFDHDDESERDAKIAELIQVFEKHTR